MIMIAIVRVSALRIENPHIDGQWVLFWQDMEASVAVIMVSLTAFRSLLGIKALKAREKREQLWFSYRRNLLTRNFKKTSQDKSEVEQLPSIPGATLAGVHTFICSDGSWKTSMAMGMTHKSNDDWPRAEGHETQNVKASHQFSTESEMVESPKPTPPAGNIV